MCLFIRLAAAALGEACTPSNDRLDRVTHAFKSDCDETEYCGSSSDLGVDSMPGAAPQNDTYDGGTTGLAKREASVCVPRTCRRDRFPFGFNSSMPMPPLCPDDQFCPDEGNGCQQLRSAGDACQLNRDGARTGWPV